MIRVADRGLREGILIGLMDKRGVRAALKAKTPQTIDEQWDCWTLCAIKIEGKNRGGKETTPVTTACPEAGK